MRISTNLMFQKHLTSITNTNVKWQESGSHLSTGKKILAPSDDPIGSSQSLILKQAYWFLTAYCRLTQPACYVHSTGHLCPV